LGKRKSIFRLALYGGAATSALAASGVRGLAVPGAHLVHVTLGGEHVSGSPFTVTVVPAATAAAMSVVTLPGGSGSGNVAADGALTPIALTVGRCRLTVSNPRSKRLELST
jgi:hypothetical protein